VYLVGGTLGEVPVGVATGNFVSSSMAYIFVSASVVSMVYASGGIVDAFATSVDGILATKVGAIYVASTCK